MLGNVAGKGTHPIADLLRSKRQDSEEHVWIANLYTTAVSYLQLCYSCLLHVSVKIS